VEELDAVLTYDLLRLVAKDVAGPPARKADDELLVGNDNQIGAMGERLRHE
jgi:hypothetical protein